MWYNELAAFVERQNWVHGAALGVGNGMMLVACLNKSSELRMLGMDLWAGETDEEGISLQEKECRAHCEQFAKRVLLLKGDATTIAKGFRMNTFDFAVYNCYNNNLANQEKLLAVWATKLKPGGYIISNDIHYIEIQEILNKVGFGAISPVIVDGKESETLKFAVLN